MTDGNRLRSTIRISRPQDACFASDLHLQDDRPALTRRFLDALASLHGRSASGQDRDSGPALFLLGDVFEYWVGDDHMPAVAIALSDALSNLTIAGWRVFLMHGNRDFLMGPGLATRCGATLLNDPCEISVGEEQIVLAHGDAQCIGDTRYQQWRSLCRSSAWQRDFFARPLGERLQMAAALRQQSREAQSLTETTADVDQATIDALITSAGARGMIHGHTHQPAMHRWLFGNLPRWRRVLSDWDEVCGRGEILDLAQIAAG